MKYIILIASFMVLSVTNYAQDKLTVVASASMLADMADQLSGDHFHIKCIVPIGGDPHLHSPTPRDAKLVAGADLILINGLTFEGWINELIENSGTKAKVITVTKNVAPITNKKYNSHDPHAWMDASNGLIYAENIKDAFQDLLPEKKAIFDQYYTSYIEQIKAVDAYIEKEIQKIPEQKRVLITSHDAFAYYGKRYGIQLEAIMGISTEAEAQTSDIIRVNKVIKEQNIPAVFLESTINPKLLNQIAKDNKVAIGGKLYADSIGDKDSPAPTYLDMLSYNTDVIVAALSSENPISSGDHLDSESSKNNWILYVGIGLLLLLGIVVMARQMNK